MTGSKPESSAQVALIVTPQYLPMLGGMERECALLAEQFSRLGYTPMVITEQFGTDLPAEQIEDGVKVIRIRSSAHRSVVVQLRVAAALMKLLLHHRDDVAFAVVRTFTLPALAVGLLKRLRLISFPTLVTAETGGAEDDVVALERRPLARLSRALVSSNDFLNGLCQANVDHMIEFGYPRQKLTMIPNGIDTSPWQTTEAPTSIERFLFLGRLDASKGIFELIEAFHNLSQQHEAIRLTFAGDGPDRDRLQSMCSELELEASIDFVGRVAYQDLGALFAAHDALVLPSYSEGMPLSVLEAAAHHRVLVASDVGDIRHLFEGRAYICAPRDRQSLEESMQSAIDDPHPRADYGRIIAAVSIERVAQELILLLRQP